MDARRNRMYRLLLSAIMLAAFLPFSFQGSSIARGAATITGGAFVDLNCNGTHDFNEAALNNWKIYLRGQVSGLPSILD